MREQREIDTRRHSSHAGAFVPEHRGQRDGDKRIVPEIVPARVSSRETAREEVERGLTSASWHLGSAVRVAFGLIWLVDAYFKWQPSFLSGLLDVMHDGAMGQPGWLMPWFSLNRALIAVQPTIWAYGIALVETVIALAVLLGFARKVTYVGGAVWSLLIWATAEGFGRTASGVATDIGTAIVYSMVFMALLAADQCERTRPYSLDAVVERRLPWWRRVAEVRR
jgi:nitrite reductase (NO-forming)